MRTFIEKAFFTRLQSAVDGVAGRSVYPNGAVPAAAPSPFLSYFSKNTEQLGRNLEGSGDLPKNIFQVDVFSERENGYLDVKQVEEMIRERFDPEADSTARGYWSDDEGGQVFVQFCKVENNTDDSRPPAFAEEHGRHAVSLNVIVIHEA